MKNPRLHIWLGLMAVLLGTSAASADSYYGFYQGDGYTISWSFNSGSVGIPYWRWYCRPRNTEVIEGPNIELEPIGEESGEPVEGELAEYRTIDLARDLMRGDYSSNRSELSVDALEEEIRRFSRESVVEAAIGAYGMHLEEFPEDTIAMREMAVALLEAKRVEEAMNLMHEAYLKNPELGIIPLNKWLLGESREPMRKLVVRAVRWSHRDPSDRGWLLVSVLMQSEDRQDRAMEMLDRAIDLGLDESIARGFGVGTP